MHRSCTVFVATLFFFAAPPHAQAQMQRDITLDLIGGALGGGLAGIAGVLTRAAIDDAMQRPRYSAALSAPRSVMPGYGASPQGNFTVLPNYSGESRTGLRFNRPSSGAISRSEPQLPRQVATIDSIIYGLDEARPSIARPRYSAERAHAPRNRAAPIHRNQTAHIRARHVARGEFQ